MKDIRINILAGCLIGIVLFSACSVTKHLPEDEILYTGGKTVIVNKSSTRVGETALTEINAALAKTPSTTLLGGFLPIPFKMWMYNDFVKYKKGFGKWMFNRFAANPPVFISTVNPEVRVKVATNLLRDYGYFNGKVTYETLVDKKDSLKASLLYTVDMKNPYFIDKSLLLSELIPSLGSVNCYCCITRPRRFGRTVMASMVGAFFGKTDRTDRS